MLLLLALSNALLPRAPLRPRGPLLGTAYRSRASPMLMDPAAEALPEAAAEALPDAGLTSSANEHGPSGAIPAAEQCPPEDVTAFELLRFTLPVLTAALSAEIMSVVDTAVVGTLGPQQLAALGPATMLSDSTVYLFFWLNVACTNLFATHFARGEHREAFTVLSDALYVGLACAALLVVGLSLGGGAALAQICAMAPGALPGAKQYLSIRIWGVPALMTSTVLQGACTGSKDATTPFIAILLGGLLNLALDVWLVLGRGMGIAGAAVATVVSQVVQVLVLAVIVRRKRRRLVPEVTAPTLLQRPPSPARLADFLSFAGPIFCVLIGKISCYNSMTLAATAGGVVALAGHQVVATVFFLGCKFGDAISQTAQAYLPACLPAAALQMRPGGTSPTGAVELSRKLILVSLLLGGTVSLAAMGAVLGCSGVFTQDGAVTAAMATVAPLLGVALSIHPTTMCLEGLLLGGRQLGFLASAYAANVLIFLTSLYAIARRGLGLRSVWAALAAFQLVRLCEFATRVRAVGLLDSLLPPWLQRRAATE
tara:strand:- start:714 stop:2333 length:1620 start_codon:yes stop_codon:yes gene_type:complete